MAKLKDTFIVLQLDTDCFYIQTKENFASVGNSLLATRIGNLNLATENLLPKIKKIFVNAKFVKIKIEYEIEDIK